MKKTRVVYQYRYSDSPRFGWRYGEPVLDYIWVKADDEAVPYTRNESDWVDYVEPPKVGEKWRYPGGILHWVVLAVNEQCWLLKSAVSLREMTAPAHEDTVQVYRRRLPEKDMVRVTEG